jgi:hypothetical protein
LSGINELETSNVMTLLLPEMLLKPFVWALPVVQMACSAYHQLQLGARHERAKPNAQASLLIRMVAQFPDMVQRLAAIWMLGDVVVIWGNQGKKLHS